jgi:hypothetical protein
MTSDRLHEARFKVCTLSPDSEEAKNAQAGVKQIEAEYRRLNYVVPGPPGTHCR